MEELGQSYGYLSLHGGKDAEENVSVSSMDDRAQLFVDRAIDQ